MPGRFRLASTLALLALLTFCARAAADTNAATTLADRYSPVIVVQPQTRPCGPGEAYRPTTVDILLGNPEVVLRRDSDRGVLLHPHLSVRSGKLILLLTAQSLIVINITGSIVYTLVIPYAAIALTLYYFDLDARSTAAVPPGGTAPDR